MDKLLIVIALLALILDTIGVPARVKWFSLAAACLVATLLV